MLRSTNEGVPGRAQWRDGRARTRIWTRAALAFSAVVILSAAEDAPPGDHPGLRAHMDARPVSTSTPGTATLSELLTEAERLVSAVEIEGDALEALHRSDVAPLVRDLIRLKDDPEHANRIALALVREGRRADIDPRLLLAVMTVENPWLELGALSPKGAVGLMQVMPFHAGGWGCGGGDLTDLDLNICHGTKILANALKRHDGDLVRALLQYNGCVVGAKAPKPDCHRYPTWVLRYTAPVAANTQ